MVQSHDPTSEFAAPPSVRQPEARFDNASWSSCRAEALDPLSDVLRMVKLTGALFFMVDASSPWGVHVPEAEAFASSILPRAQHVVSYHIVLEGTGWAGIPNACAVTFEGGDVLVFPHGDAYAMLSEAGQPPEYDAEATLAFLLEMVAGRLPLVVTEGGGGPNGARFVCGYLGCDARPFNPVLATLPRLLHVPRAAAREGDPLASLIQLTLTEIGHPRAGGEAIRLRLSELIFVEVVRRHLETLPAGQSGWLSGLRDPAIGRALAMLHERPAHPWTLGELSKRVGMSRAVLAQRFAHLVGCPPMQYLMLWRMQIAARAIADRAMKIAAVAHEVGYDSEAAFSRAFKKATGLSPAAWRDRHAGKAVVGRFPSDRPHMA
jgi:AraC-like DNA-binding protein